MAQFDADRTNQIQQYLDRLGFPVTFWDVKNDTIYTTEEDKRDYYYSKKYEFNPNSDFNDKYASPCVVKSIANGDVYNLYFRDGFRAYDIERYLIAEDNVLVSNDNYNVLVEFVKKGTKFLVDGREVLSADAESSEFANLENFDSIEAPNYSVMYADNPQISEASKILNVDELTDVQLQKAKDKIVLCEAELLESLKASENGELESAMWTFDEIDELYNSKITNDDKRAFIIYLQNKNKKKLIGDFATKYGSEYPAKAEDIIELMKKGALFFDPTAKLGERLQPKVIYKSGNIWKKQGSLNNEMELYISRFGDDIYNTHIETLKPAYTKMWENRLRVSGEDKSLRITILPISEFAKNIYVSDTINPRDRQQINKNFNVYTSFDKGEIITDVANLKGGSRSSNFVEKANLNLIDAFIFWCKQAGSGTYSSDIGVTWSSSTTNIETLINRYLKPERNPFKDEKQGKDKWERAKDDARKVGNRLFAQFLAEGLQAKDQTKVEVLWNSIYNSYLEPQLDEVPIGFTYKKYLDNRSLFLLKSSNLNALRYYMSRGSLGLAYGVGLGKTFCAIFVMKQALDLGLAKRPLVIVPNQVYFQFSQEIKRGLGSEFDGRLEGSRLNMFYNGTGIYNQMGNNAVDGINLCTYEATENFVFDEQLVQGEDWVTQGSIILEMGGGEPNADMIATFTEKSRESLFNDFEVDTDLSETTDDDFVTDAEIDEIIDSETTFDSTDDEDDLGDYKKGGAVDDKPKTPKKPIEPIFINVESTSYDMVCVDEAHNYNALFQKVISAPKEIQSNETSKKTGKLNIQRETNPYSQIRETGSGKDSSKRAEKLWWISRYVQHISPMGNTMLLSATPFTNSPLQVFTMMSFLNYEMLSESELGVLKDFFDLFAKIEYAEDFKTDLSIVKRNKFIGWNNVIALQRFVFRVFDKSSREDEDKSVIRPNKIVLPLKRMLVDGKVYEFAKENQISTTIQLSNLQKQLWENVKKYAGGKQDANGNIITYEELCSPEMQNTTSLGKYTAPKPKKVDATDDTQDTNVDNPDDLLDGTKEGEKANAGVKALQCLMWGRQICLNPYLFKCSGFKVEPTAKMYVEQSPKLLYTMLCIKSVKEYHESSEVSSKVSGQVIYMNFGVKAFGLIRDYLVSEIGFDINEIGIISGSGNYIGKKLYESKQKVADTFLGRVLDTETGVYTQLEDSKRIKVLIGSEAIKEGINLQDYASVLYNCFLDFNPTDQVQVEGRIWRQGNAFANVRIVTPLMSDCIDVFMFQKLEDKTERINQIWTRNGNLNELDTTAFDPAELKYELISDPEVIAKLEREYKEEKIEEQIVDEGEIFSQYSGLKTIYTTANQILNPQIKVNYEIQSDFRLGMYYNISQIRPDLITKPLLNKEGFDKFLKDVSNLEGSPSYDDLKDSYKNLYQWKKYTDRSSSDAYSLYDVNNPLTKVIIEKLYNYSTQELIDLMVDVLKGQKIAYPLNYTKHWRDNIPKPLAPIIEGDEVEFDTKKGRKKGIVDLVSNPDGKSVLESFYANLGYLQRNEGYDWQKIVSEVSPKTKIILWEGNDAEDSKPMKKSLDELNEDEKTILKQLLKYYYEKELSESNSIGYSFIPSSVDIDELEDLNIVDKNIKKVEKAQKVEKVKKEAKYPEPFTWTNKERNKNLAEISQYLGFVEYPKFEEKFGNYDGSGNNVDWQNEFYKEPKEQVITAYANGFISIIYMLLKDYDSTSTTINNLKMNFNEDYFNARFKADSLWVELEENTFPQYLFAVRNNNPFYRIEYPRKLAEFKIAEVKTLQPLGINSENDLDILMNTQKEKIASLKLEKEQLSDSQVFAELIEEVKRRQEALNTEEIRKGASFRGRAETFGNPNPDYKGNDYLTLFANSNKKVKTAKTIKDIQKEVVETLVIEESPLTLLQEKIDALSMLLDVYVDDKEELMNVQEKIDALNDVMEAYNI